MSNSYNVHERARIVRIACAAHHSFVNAHEFRRARVSRWLHWENVVSMTSEYRFDDLDLREEPARFEADPDVFSDSVTTTPKTDMCSASCMTCYGARA
jgi:hypothetical protein